MRYGLLAAVGVALFVAPFACSWPDGLERVAARLGFEDKATRPVLVAPRPGYHVPGIHWAAGATALAGAAGAVVVFGAGAAAGAVAGAGGKAVRHEQHVRFTMYDCTNLPRLASYIVHRNS